MCRYLILGLMLFAWMLGGCGTGGGTTGGTETGTTEAGEDFFFTAAKEVGPTFEASSTQGLKLAQAGKSLSSSDGLVGTVFEALRDYQFPADEGRIDMHNIYKVIHTAGQIYETAETGCTTITETAVPSPFDLGIDDTYTCAGNEGTMSDAYANGFAIKPSGGVKYGLLTFRWASSEHGVLQGSYNATTGDLNLRMVELVDHDDSHFYVRSHIAGNAETHAFTLRLITGSITDTSEFVSLVGKGISEGEGNYFLFKVMTDAIDGNYICLPATATEATLEALVATSPNGSVSVDASCADYRTDVDAMTFLTTGEVPLELSDFTGSSILITTP